MTQNDDVENMALLMTLETWRTTALNRRSTKLVPILQIRTNICICVYICIIYQSIYLLEVECCPI